VVAPVVAKRSIIYPAYTIGAALVVLLMLVAVYRTRRLRAPRVRRAMSGEVDS
jgi:hypothetical protein